jgi:DNA-binding SARP family transcriptional activator/TolB-like protein/Tfp pilus assembly protein PilF
MLRLRTLGVVDLRTADGEEVRAALAQPKRVALLAYLALVTPRGWQRRDRVMALFWPEMDDEHARNALNQALFFLRRHLGADTVLTRNAEEISLNPEALWCDAVAFEEAIAEKRYAEAIDLYKGELLAAFHVPEGASELEHWIESERQRLIAFYASALQAVAREREAAVDFAGAVMWWRRLAAQNPQDGQVALRLMRALESAGDRAGALEHARVYSLLAREELGVEPDAAIVALAKQLREPPTEVPVATWRPAPPSPRELPGEPNEARPASRSSWNSLRRVVRGGVVALLAVIGLVFVLHRTRAAHADPVITKIAVMPFVNLTNDPSKEYLADIMTDVLTTEVARYRELDVYSRMTLMQLKGAKLSAAQVADTLKTDAFVEGTITGDARHLLVNVQLIYAPNDRHLWAERYLRDSANVLAVVGDIATAIAREIHLHAAPEPVHPGAKPPANAASYALYLRGQTEMLSRTPEALRKAADNFRRSIALDSSSARGYAGLAEMFHIAGADGYLPLAIARDSARQFATQALRLDSLLPEAHTALGAIESDAANWQVAEHEFLRAIELGPSDPLAYHWYAQFLAIHDRLDEALVQIQKGKRIDPVSASLDRTMGPIEVSLGLQKPSSQRSADAVLNDPAHAWSRATYAGRLSQEGKCVEARAHIDTAHAMIRNNPRMLLQVFAVEWRCGDRRKAKVLLDSIKRRSDARATGLWIAGVYNAWGQRDSVWVWLDSVEWNGDRRFNFRIGQQWKWVRTDPHYPRVLRQMGLAEQR